MLIIRKEQMAALSDASEARFEQEMVVRLEGFGGPSISGLDHRELRKAVRSGIAQARRGGFTLRGPIRLYLEGAVILGYGFHDDPQYLAISATLAQSEHGSEMDRAQALFDALLDYREQVIGQEQEHLRAALEGLRLIAVNQVAMERSRDDLVDLLWYVYPEKAGYVGVDGLRALIREGQGLIRAMQLNQRQDDALICTLMMIFGHGCFADPFLPWIGDALAGAPGVAASRCGGLLQELTQARVQQILVNCKTTR